MTAASQGLPPAISTTANAAGTDSLGRHARADPFGQPDRRTGGREPAPRPADARRYQAPANPMASRRSRRAPPAMQPPCLVPALLRIAALTAAATAAAPAMAIEVLWVTQVLVHPRDEFVDPAQRVRDANRRYAHGGAVGVAETARLFRRDAFGDGGVNARFVDGPRRS